MEQEPALHAYICCTLPYICGTDRDRRGEGRCTVEDIWTGLVCVYGSSVLPIPTPHRFPPLPHPLPSHPPQAWRHGRTGTWHGSSMVACNSACLPPPPPAHLPRHHLPSHPPFPIPPPSHSLCLVVVVGCILLTLWIWIHFSPSQAFKTSLTHAAHSLRPGALISASPPSACLSQLLLPTFHLSVWWLWWVGTGLGLSGLGRNRHLICMPLTYPCLCMCCIFSCGCMGTFGWADVAGTSFCVFEIVLETLSPSPTYKTMSSSSWRDRRRLPVLAPVDM